MNMWVNVKSIVKHFVGSLDLKGAISYFKFKTSHMSASAVPTFLGQSSSEMDWHKAEECPSVSRVHIPKRFWKSWTPCPSNYPGCYQLKIQKPACVMVWRCLSAHSKGNIRKLAHSQLACLQCSRILIRSYTICKLFQSDINILHDLQFFWNWGWK